MSVFYQTEAQVIRVSGKTYPYRELLRNLGGVYQSEDKSWCIPNLGENLSKVEELCRSIGGGVPKAKPESKIGRAS
jgi:hypothetical protein